MKVSAVRSDDVYSKGINGKSVVEATLSPTNEILDAEEDIGNVKKNYVCS